MTRILESTESVAIAKCQPNLEGGDDEGDDGGPETDPDAPREVGQLAVAELEERLVVQQDGPRDARDDERRAGEEGEEEPWVAIQ